MLRGVAGPHGGGLPAFLLACVDRLERLSAAEEESTNDPRLSQSLLRALTILRFLSLAGGELGIYEVARGVEGTPSMTRRYLVTLRQIGLVEQSEETYKYRLATAPEKKARRGSSAVDEPVVRLALCDARRCRRCYAVSPGRTGAGCVGSCWRARVQWSSWVRSGMGRCRMTPGFPGRCCGRWGRAGSGTPGPRRQEPGNAQRRTRAAGAGGHGIGCGPGARWHTRLAPSQRQIRL